MTRRFGLPSRIGRAAQRVRGCATLFLAVGAVLLLAAQPGPTVRAEAAPARSQSAPPLSGRTVAVGVVGASAISQVGAFHPGGHLRDFELLATLTAPGRILDPERLLVASSSNYGMPLAIQDRPPGSILSIDPRAPVPLVVPSDFAAPGGQATALDGRVGLFTGQGPAFLNRLNNPAARSADLPSVSNPRGITINNGFGRPWFASAPEGPAGPGLLSTVDSDGTPRRFSPSVDAGGVFWGDLTNRSPQLQPGTLRGVVGTAFLGGAPDGPRRGLYAALNADGSLAQVHVGLGTDGLAPPGTVGALERVDEGDPTVGNASATRAGMAFNWVPDRLLYVADPTRNAVVVLSLGDEGDGLKLLGLRRIESDAFRVPVDIAPAVAEMVNPLFAGNTTLAGGADLYVANRGDGTIVRLAQDGTVRAVRQVVLPGVGAVGPGQLNGIAVSADARRIYVTVGPPADDASQPSGSVLELPAFDAGSS